MGLSHWLALSLTSEDKNAILDNLLGMEEPIVLELGE